MATKIVTKNSSTASAVPTASDLVQGELAVNVADKRLFTEDNGGSIVELGTNPSTIDINAGTIDGTAIGASSASTGAFTTLTATGAFTSVGIDDNATSTAITIDSSENVGIGTSSPSNKLEIRNDVSASVDLDPTAIKLYNNSDGGSAIEFSNGVGAKSKISLGVETTGAGTDDSYLGFSTGANTALSERMRIDSAGNVGIGTSAPAQKLHISDSAPFARLESTSTSYNGFTTKNDSGNFYFGIDDSGGNFYGSAYARAIYADGAYPVTFYTNATERMRIDSSGNVGIGTTSPSEKLQVEGTVSATGMKIGANGTDINSTFLGASSLIAFKCNGTERMRIDSSGNLLVGTTNTAPASSGNVAGSSLLAIGKAEHSRDGGVVLALNRKTSDGTIAEFRKDGSSVGSIGSYVGSHLRIGSGASNLLFADPNEILPSTSSGAASNGLINLGSTDRRFKDIHFSGYMYGDLLRSGETLPSSTDFNDLKISGFYRVDNNATNAPSTAYHALVIYGNSSNVVTQIATSLQSTTTYVRSFNTAWTSWARLDT